MVDPPKRKREEESDEGKLEPRSYEWTRSFLSGDSYWAPTRFDLFRARKQFETGRRICKYMKKLLKIRLMKKDKLDKMVPALKVCINQFTDKIEEETDRLENLVNLITTKRITRLTETRFVNLKTEMKDIAHEITMNLREIDELMELDSLSDEIVTKFIGDVSCLNDRVAAHRKSREQLLGFLER